MNRFMVGTFSRLDVSHSFYLELHGSNGWSERDNVILPIVVKHRTVKGHEEKRGENYSDIYSNKRVRQIK